MYKYVITTSEPGRSAMVVLKSPACEHSRCAVYWLVPGEVHTICYCQCNDCNHKWLMLTPIGGKVPRFGEV